MTRYRDAGVDVDAGEEAVRRIRGLVESTHTPNMVTGVGSFGGACVLPGGDPDLLVVSSIDGVGTKLKVAILLDRYDTVGEDLVNHCVGDIAVHGAEPVFFLDYVAMGKLEPERMEKIVDGVARGCRNNGCALLGGETAEMPGVYRPPDFDLVGVVVGTVRRENFVDGSTLVPGDRLIGYPSTGLHTNGYSLARRVLLETASLPPDDEVPGSKVPVGEALLAVHRPYLPVLRGLRGRMKGAAHITGGGLPGNVKRILPSGTAARIDIGAWVVPHLFQLIADLGDVPRDDLYRTFNMGIGLVVGVGPDHADAVLEEGHGARLVGEVVAGSGEVHLDGEPRWP